jgi:hypothetical protein
MLPPESTDLHAGVNPRRRTTRVNLFVVFAVLVFFAIGALVLKRTGDKPPQTLEEAAPLR